ncbi:MAG: XDD4 family exosortase-dependent surface protein, partial [Phycisphaerae bacterium]
MPRIHRTLFLAAAGAAWASLGGPSASLAETSVIDASLGNLSASVAFETSGTDLLITLSNTSTADVLDPAEILTAVFFNIAAAPMTLTPVSAVIGPSSTVLFGGTDPGGGVGGEWAFRDSLQGAPGGRSYGISSTSFGLFSAAYLFPGSDLERPRAPDGLQYG